jgi:hypothetical protein
MSKTFTIEDLDEASVAWVAEEAARRGIDEQTVLKELIRQGIGQGNGPHLPVYRDLDELAGTWTAEEAEEFRKATELFNRVDEDLWR